MQGRVLGAAATAAAIALVAACGGAGEETSVVLPDDATVTYALADVLADERLPTPASVWETLGATLPSVQGLSARNVFPPTAVLTPEGE